MDISLQLFSVREEFAADPEGTLKALAEMGYNGVEFAGYAGKTAEEMKALLEKYNLYAKAAHEGGASFSEEKLEPTLQYLQTIGCKYMICPWADVATYEAADALVSMLNRAAKVAKKYGIKVGYHNHAHEFVKLGDEYAMDYVAARLDDDVVLELDVFWVYVGGVDPIEYIKKWGSKVELIHLKQSDAKKANVDMGDGILDMKAIIEASKYAKDFIVEHEEFDKPVMDAVRNDVVFLKKI